MEEFTQLFGNLLAFVYHCFDRIVIHGYLSGLSRPEQVVYFVRQVMGLPLVSKEVLSQRTRTYQNWVEAYARNHQIPMEWAEKGVRKEDYVSPRLNRLVKKNTYGVYFIFKSMEQGRTFRISTPKYPTSDPNYRILAHQRSRFTHYYFYIRDEVLGPIVLRVASFFPFHATYWLNGHSFIEQELNRTHLRFRKHDNAFLAVDDGAALQAAADRLSPQIIRKRLDYWTFLLGPKFSKKERSQMNLSRFYALAQLEYARNFIFKRHFPIHQIFERSCELGLWRLTAHRISEIFGVRLHKRLRGKLATVLEQFEHGHHVFRAYWKNAFLKQYEKFACFLRNELCSNNLRDFGLKKGLDHLEAVRTRFQTITDRFASFQAQCLNVHIDFPLLQRLALPITLGSVRYPGIKIHDTRIIRLLEVLLHGGNMVGGWTARQIHQAVLTTFHLSPKTYDLNQLPYDLRKLKGHGLLQRDGSRYAYRLTPKGIQVALLFLFFHKRLCGPLANSRFHHSPDPTPQPASPLEQAYYKADKAIQKHCRPTCCRMMLQLPILNYSCLRSSTQESKGRLIVTAALELSRNQVTHFYSEKKNTQEMIKMMNLVRSEYRNCSAIYLSWDAASWHISRDLARHVKQRNDEALAEGYPVVKTAPLPAGAQFLNVIESVFSGMARAIIHNSDYCSVEAAKDAIDRYYTERNEYFQAYPKRAGRKVWGQERVQSEFCESNNCKDPLYCW